MGHPIVVYYQFLSGATMMAAWTAGVFFLRFWKKTKDRLFLTFAFAFWLIAVDRIIILIIGDPEREDQFWIYLTRLLAFVLILWAIYDKNRKKEFSPKHE